MQSFTQTEIKWMIGALQEKARAYHEAARMADGADNSNKSLDGSLYRLRNSLMRWPASSRKCWTARAGA